MAEAGEAAIGVGLIGAGTFMVYAAFHNKNPLAALKTFVATGSVDFSTVPEISVAESVGSTVGSIVKGKLSGTGGLVQAPPHTPVHGGIGSG